VAVIGSTELAATHLGADLSKGEVAGRGAVRARTRRPQGDLTLACERARWTLVLDPAKRKLLPHEKRELAAPAELLGFTAEEEVVVTGPDGLKIEADRVDLAGGTLVATRAEGRAHMRAKDADVFARRIEARDQGEDARSFELTGDVSIARVQSGTWTSLE